MASADMLVKPSQTAIISNNSYSTIYIYIYRVDNNKKNVAEHVGTISNNVI